MISQGFPSLVMSISNLRSAIKLSKDDRLGSGKVKTEFRFSITGRGINPT